MRVQQTPGAVIVPRRTTAYLLVVSPSRCAGSPLGIFPPRSSRLKSWVLVAINYRPTVPVVVRDLKSMEAEVQDRMGGRQGIEGGGGGAGHHRVLEVLDLMGKGPVTVLLQLIAVGCLTSEDPWIPG